MLGIAGRIWDVRWFGSLVRILNELETIKGVS
jgi:hypothetical protein